MFTHFDHYNRSYKHRARRLRKASTKAESRLWQHVLRRRQLGYPFKRQRAFDWFILDFFCSRLRLAIEVDGGYHLSEEQMAKDKRRDAHLKERGYRVVRITNQEVMEQLPEVRQMLTNVIREIEQSEWFIEEQARQERVREYLRSKYGEGEEETDGEEDDDQ